MRVIIDMIDAIAEVALAFGTVAELQTGTVDVCSAADGAFVAVGLFLSGFTLLGCRPPEVRLRVVFPAIICAPICSFPAREEIFDIAPKKQEIVQQRD